MAVLVLEAGTLVAVHVVDGRDVVPVVAILNAAGRHIPMCQVSLIQADLSRIRIAQTATPRTAKCDECLTVSVEMHIIYRIASSFYEAVLIVCPQISV